MQILIHTITTPFSLKINNNQNNTLGFRRNRNSKVFRDRVFHFITMLEFDTSFYFYVIIRQIMNI